MVYNRKDLKENTFGPVHICASSSANHLKAKIGLYSSQPTVKLEFPFFLKLLKLISVK